MSQVRLESRDGRPVIVDGGIEQPAWLLTTPAPTSEWMCRMSHAGLNGFSFSATADFHPYALAKPVWLEHGQYDYTEVDARVGAVLDSHPQAWLLPRLYVGSPPWWDALHPDELVGLERPVVLGELGHGFSKLTAASFASDAWLKCARENVTSFIRHAYAQGWGERVPAVLICSGTSEEWIHVGAMEGLLPDVGATARRKFRLYLKTVYGSDDELTLAWGRSERLSEVEPPTFDRRRLAVSGAWIDPRLFRDVLDFHRFLSILPAQFLVEIADAVSTASQGAWKAGAFYGYLAEMTFHPDALRFGGPLGLSHVLHSKKVAFLASPSSYARRDLRSGASLSMLPTASLHTHGVMAFHESDIRTHALVDDAGYGRTESLVDTISMQIREAGVALARGMGFWWFDMTGSFHDEPAVSDIMRRLTMIARKSQVSGAPRARAAMVVDEEALEVLCGYPDRLSDALPRQLVEIARSGLSCEVVRLADLTASHGYDVLIFPILERVEPETLVRLRAVTASARLVIYNGRVGLGPTMHGAPVLCGTVTGLPMTAVAEAVASDSVDQNGLPFGRGFWSTHDIRVDESQVDVLARRREDHVASTFMALREGTWIAYALEPPISASMLAQIYERAGVYVDVMGSASMNANDTLVCVTQGVGLSATFQTISAWYDELSGRSLAPRDGLIRLSLRQGDSIVLSRR